MTAQTARSAATFVCGRCRAAVPLHRVGDHAAEHRDAEPESYRNRSIRFVNGGPA